MHLLWTLIFLKIYSTKEVGQGISDCNKKPIKNGSRVLLMY